MTNENWRRSMAWVGAGVLVVSMASFFRVPLLPDIGAELSMSASQLGMVTTLFGIGRLVADLPAGHLADRLPVGAALGVGGGLLAAGSLLLGAAHQPSVVLGASLLLGVASSIANTTGMTYFSAAAPLHRRGSAMAAFSAALLGGQALGPMVGGLLAAVGTWRTALFAAALVGAVLAGMLFPTAMLRRRSPWPRHRIAEDSTDGAAGPMPPAEKIALYAVPFSVFFTLGAMPQTVVPLIGADAFSLSAATIGLALGAGGAFRLLGAVIGGAISDHVSRKAALVPALSIQAVGVGLLAWRGTLVTWLAAIVLMSIASSGIAVAATMLGDRSSAAEAGRSLGRFRFVGDVGLIAGPFLAGVLYETYGQVAAAVVVAVLLGASAAGAATVLTETRWQAPEAAGLRSDRPRPRFLGNEKYD